MKALKITHCNDRLMWYADHVGKTVPLVREEADGYVSREPAGYTNIVKKKDAAIVDVHPSQVLYLTPYERRGH